MTVEGTNSSTILVLDDHYAVESDEFYSRKDFERDFGTLSFKFVFSLAWDEGARQYTSEAALQAVSNAKPQGILLDVMFGSNRTNRLGVGILRELTRKHPEIPVVMMTSVARDELWAECARLGAVDYLVKPMSDRLLAQTLHRYVGVDIKHWLIGQNKHFLAAINLAAMAAEGKRTPIMITGETGTGKDLLANFVHRHGRGANTPFKVICLPNIPPDLQHSTLFGHRKGAFTGADRDSPGSFKEADGGVVFLDEIGDIITNAQLLLLRVADSGEVTRVGDGKTSKVNVQIVSATNADLPKKIKANEFRYDLWARLSGMPVALPSLEQRREDIPLLVRHFLRCEALCRKRPVPVLSEEMETRLQGSFWDGNVRGLSSYAQRVFDLAGGELPDESIFQSALSLHAELIVPLPLPPPIPQQAEERVGVSVKTLEYSAPAVRFQHLRLEELGLLHHALLETRPGKNRAFDRANAAALLKGKPYCSTNEFDRWIKRLWGELDTDSRAVAARRYPEIMFLVDRIPDNKEHS
jgi:two-component system response regulator FlrC